VLKITEKQLESLILDWLNAQPGVFAFKVQTVGVYDEKRKLFRKNRNKHIHIGTPDIHGVCQGRAFYIEVKRPGGKPTEAQKAFLRKAASHGAIVGIAYSLDGVERIIEMLRR
jgi:VRR-NUC domain-containing protein